MVLSRVSVIISILELQAFITDIFGAAQAPSLLKQLLLVKLHQDGSRYYLEVRSPLLPTLLMLLLITANQGIMPQPTSILHRLLQMLSFVPSQMEKKDRMEYILILLHLLFRITRGKQLIIG